MADAYVQVLPDGSGKKIQSFENTIGANVTETQAVVIVDQFGAPVAAATTGLTDAQLRATAVPVSGTFWLATQPISAAALPLPSGAATAANQQSNALTDTQLRATPVPVSGTVTATGGLTDTQLRATAVPVSLATAPTTPVTGTFWQVTQPVSGTVTANAGTGTQAVSLATNTPDVTDRAARLLGHVTVDTAPTTAVTGTFWQATQPVSNVSLPLPSGAATSALQSQVTPSLNTGVADTGTQRVVLASDGPAVVGIGTTTQTKATDGTTTAWSMIQLLKGIFDKLLGSLAVTGTFWQATQPVSVAATVATKETRSATPTQTSVANSASSVTVIAANANRLGATVFNDDTLSTGATLKLKLGATASASSFTVAIAAQGYYEVPFNYTGIIDGIASAATGNARITELT